MILKTIFGLLTIPIISVALVSAGMGLLKKIGIVTSILIWLMVTGIVIWFVASQQISIFDIVINLTFYLALCTFGLILIYKARILIVDRWLDSVIIPASQPKESLSIVDSSSVGLNQKSSTDTLMGCEIIADDILADSPNEPIQFFYWLNVQVEEQEELKLALLPVDI